VGVRPSKTHGYGSDFMRSSPSPSVLAEHGRVRRIAVGDAWFGGVTGRWRSLGIGLYSIMCEAGFSRLSEEHIEGHMNRERGEVFSEARTMYF